MSYFKGEEGILYSFFENESKVKELYSLYRLKFPEHKNLWEALVKKENGHIKILKDLCVKFKGGEDFLKISEYSAQVIGYIGNFIDRQLERVRLNKIVPKEALGTALSIEQSMVEKKSFEMFTPLCVDIEEAFERLNRQGEYHIKALTKAYGKAR